MRCGTCKEVFDGNAALLDPGAALLPAAHAAPAKPEPVATPAAAPIPLPALTTIADDIPATAAPLSSDKEAVYALDFDTSFDPFGILPEAAQAEGVELVAVPEVLSAQSQNSGSDPEDLPPPHASEPVLDLDLDAESEPQLAAPFKRRQIDEVPAFATYLRDSRREPRLDSVAPVPATVADVIVSPKVSLDKAEPSFDAVPAPMPAPAATRQEPSWEAPQTSLAAPAEPASTPESIIVLPADEPAFVTQGRRREQSGKALQVALAAGSVFLLLLLLLQVMTTFRNPLAAQFPQFKPALSTLCSLSGCKVDLPAQIEALAIEQGELQTLAPQTFSYVSLLRNHSRSVQAWPSIELTLDDSDDKPVLRRVITPREYLPANINVASGLAPRSEQTVKVYFTTQQAKAAGYHIAIFYP